MFESEIRATYTIKCLFLFCKFKMQTFEQTKKTGSGQTSLQIIRLYGNYATRMASSYWPLLSKWADPRARQLWEAKASMSNKPGSFLSANFNIIHRQRASVETGSKQQVSIWIQPSEAEGAGGLAVLRYSALLVNKCLIEQ